MRLASHILDETGLPEATRPITRRSGAMRSQSASCSVGCGARQSNQSSPKNSTGCCVRDVPLPQAMASAGQYFVAAPAQALGMGRVNREFLCHCTNHARLPDIARREWRNSGHALWSIGGDPVNDRDQACSRRDHWHKEGIRFLRNPHSTGATNGHFVLVDSSTFAGQCP